MFVVSLIASLVACKPAPTPAVDNDGDGYPEETDCNDDLAAINPEAQEICDGIDQNCDGEIDEGLIGTYYRDSDGDGYGNVNESLIECGRPAGYVDDDTDCDDSEPTANPGIEVELCDDIDHNCDGDAFADATGGEIYWLDADGDTFGDSSTEFRSCAVPTDAILADGTQLHDCDDHDSAINPAADELCATAYDDNCNGQINEGTPVDGLLLPLDLDGDGRGHQLVTVCGLGAAVDADGDGLPDGITVAADMGGDCDDTNAHVSPDLPELCDGLDNDCDVTTDENDTAVDRPTFWVDTDMDGSGDSNVHVLSCEQPDGYVSSSIPEDCDDANPQLVPGAAELCDTIDNNCDGLVDDGSSVDATNYYVDNDNDTFGNAAGQPTPSCAPVPGLVPNNFDCDDADDQSGQAELRYRDHDGDLFGDPNDAQPNCIALPGYVSNDADCDDTNEFVNPDVVWYADSDGDGFGDTADSQESCLQPAHYVSDDLDCNDTDPHINPDVELDVCDTTDNDCDGHLDEDCVLEHCGTISAPETWDADRIHRVTCNVFVQGPGAQLTIADGTEVQFQGNSRLRIGISDAGSLSILGSLGVELHSDPLNPQPWGGVEFGRFSNNSYVSNTTITGAGANGYGILVDRASLTLENVSVVDTEGIGIEVEDGALDMTGGAVTGSSQAGISIDSASALETLEGVSISGGDEEPLYVPFPFVGELDNDNHFSGNGIDEVVLTNGAVEADTTVALLDVPYRVQGNVDVGGGGAPELVVEDQVVMRFTNNAEIDVGRTEQGSLVVEGPTTGEARVLFIGDLETAGQWRGIRIGAQANDSSLSGLEIRHGGANGVGNIHVIASGAVAPEERPLVTLTNVVSADSSFSGLYSDSARLQVLDSVFQDNLAYGAVLDNVVFADSDIHGSSFEDNALSGVRVDPYLVELLPGNGYAGNALPIEVVPGTVVDSALWARLDEDYYITGLIRVQDAESPELTLEPDTTLYFAATGEFQIGTQDQGSLIIDGNATHGVEFSSIDDYLELAPERGSYPGLTIGAGNRVSALRGLSIRYAGSSGAALTINGDGDIPLEIADAMIELSGSNAIEADGPRLDIHDSAFVDNDDQGLLLSGSTRLVDNGGRSFARNIISGNGLHALSIGADNLGQLDLSSTFSGNNLLSGEPDRILIAGNVTTPFQTWVNLDANYWMEDTIIIGGPNNPVVTIEPGVMFELSGVDTEFRIAPFPDRSGGIIAVGTESENIVFTSADAWEGAAAPGDYYGVYLGADCLTPDGPLPGEARCILDEVTIDYGGSQTEEGALMVEPRRTLPYSMPVIMNNLTVRYSGTTGLQFQSRNGIISPNPAPALDLHTFEWVSEAQMSRGDGIHLVACEGVQATGECLNYDFCYDVAGGSPDRHGITDNVFCGNSEANVGARNFNNPFTWRACLNDGPLGTDTCDL